MIEDQVYQIIKEAVDAYGSVNKLYHKTGCAPSTIDAYMKGIRCPNLRTAEYLLGELGFELVIKRKGWRDENNARN